MSRLKKEITETKTAIGTNKAKKINLNISLMISLIRSLVAG